LKGVYQTHDFSIHFGKKQFCVKFVTQFQISKISIKTSKELTLTFSLCGCLSDTWFEYSSFMCVDKDLWKLKLFLPNTTVTKCYICEWTFKRLLMKKPQSDFFRVWTIFMFHATYHPYKNFVWLIKILKVKAVAPKQNSDKMLYLWMNFQKLFYENPQSDFFRVRTSFMFVDKDLLKLKLFL
jgi:hypothetical protein